MTSLEISNELKTFIINYLESIGELEVLLFLHKHKNSIWSVKAIEEEMRSSHLAAKAQLETLHSKGLISKINSEPTSYNFDLKNPNLIKVVNELSELYPSYRVAIITLIYDRKIEKSKIFSNAFKITK